MLRRRPLRRSPLSLDTDPIVAPAQAVPPFWLAVPRTDYTPQGKMFEASPTTGPATGSHGGVAGS